MFELELNQLSDADNLGPVGFNAILKQMQETIDAGEAVQINGAEVLTIRTQEELDSFIENL